MNENTSRVLNGHLGINEAHSVPSSAAAAMGKLSSPENTITNNNNNNVTANGQKNPAGRELLLMTSAHESDGRGGTGGTGTTRRGDPRYLDVIRERPIRVTVKVLVPVREHPKFNFVGKLLGPKGNSMKRLQEETLTKMAVLGRGSMRDKQKEEDLRASGDPKYVHLLEDLHVEITAFASPAEAHARIAYALAEVRRYLVPDNNDDIRKEQIREMELISDPQAAGGAAAATEGGGGGGVTGERPPPSLTPPELLSPDGPDCRGAVVGPVPQGPPLPPGLRGRAPPPHPRLLAARGLPPLVRKLPAALPPPVPPPPAKRRVLSILDKAKLALDHSYGIHEDDHRHYSFETPEFAYDDYADYGPEDFAEVYSGEPYDGAGAGRWLAYKQTLPSAMERARCRTSPYARPK
ncbi:KH domain-containing, RNA-binding, signal transduction-associated protein 3 isoform X2 [Procambarus clarkii]|uniref:KH domain-containing, RNA-binding, signal transduction-associated protein 3 isoform X2 n=1 Tax=Procambarus clarkii TaxID=6728 RepID=UPI001E6730AA|nr:KH domain-containing, RNA-binding, signal transduction-associated protein 3-like [Procambarus clarkii]XP_045615234.1 KH domain-containing, RNA-binding, signal transduction-associated protein 3-like [Procambarus clarkii]